MRGGRRGGLFPEEALIGPGRGGDESCGDIGERVLRDLHRCPAHLLLWQEQLSFYEPGREMHTNPLLLRTFSIKDLKQSGKSYKVFSAARII